MSLDQAVIALVFCLGVVAFAFFGYHLWHLVRYLWADVHLKASMRRALRIRWTWKALARRLDLAPVDKSKIGNQGPTTHQTGPVPRLIPSLSTKVDLFSVRCTIRTVPGVNVTRVEARQEDLCNAWRVGRVKVTGVPGVITARAFLREPLEAIIPSPLVREVVIDDQSAWETVIKPASLRPTDPVLWGISEDADQVTSTLAGGSHGILAGRTRSGKSICGNTLLAVGSLTRHVRLVVIDPNLAAAAPWWRTAYRVTDSTDPDDATVILDEIIDDLEQRKGFFWKQRTDRIVKFSDDVPLYLTVVDELSGYTSHPDKRKADRFVASLLKFAAQSAKFGGRLWILTQQPGSSTFPTAIRMNLTDRISFQVDTADDFKMMFPDARELPVTAADRSMPQGVGIASVGGMKTAERFRAVYLPTEACWSISDAICAAGGQLRELPTEDTRHLSIVKARDEEGTVPVLASSGRDRWRKRAS
jgi:S-DNA-T family DNA segregation ATPase FtsK/SpoIIIE